ncbi:EamA family transporter [Natrarchaeobius chitinivorans]|uniref:Multidrug transporter n=1 Tax=Natrarchaeobius chitinivorans TaxID=1679083 RepID=A0A3N6MR23_NATCH|nr:EamA family transporter [Natrarchaeobius chitinivorans]RQG97086.1 multidrug transporter [Natrarchaeobius chitinivorans]
MARRYLVLSVIAFGAYSLVAPLLKIAMETIPSTMAVFLSNVVMFSLLAAALVYARTSPIPYLTHPKLPHIIAWGVVLAIGLLAYYRALALGPISVVVPIYGLFIAVSSGIGVVAFGESVTRRKIAGVGMAILAIVLMSI